MANTVRFACQSFFTFGLLSLVVFILYAHFQKARRRGFSRNLENLSDRVGHIYHQFSRWLVKDELRDAENFLITELRRENKQYPQIKSELLTKFAHVFMQAFDRHRKAVAKSESQPLLEKIKQEVIGVLTKEHDRQMHETIRNQCLILIPPLVAGAFFLPLLFYTKLLIMQSVHPGILAGIGFAALIGSLVILLRLLRKS